MLALLAFIAGDVFQRGQSKNPVVGEVNGVKIKYSEFLQEHQAQEAIMGGTGVEAADEASNRAWSELVTKNAFMPGFNTLGLTVTPQETDDMMNGTGGGYISPVMEQYFRNPETGMFDHAVLERFIYGKSDTQNPNAQRDAMLWQMIQKQANDERIFSKYAALVGGGVFVNDQEVKAAVDAENATYDARVVFKPYSSIADSTVTIAQSEISAYYNAHKERFRRDASRNIEYVVFDIVPSESDMAAAQTRVGELAGEFAGAADPVAYATANSEDKSAPTFVREAAIDPVALGAMTGEGSPMHGPALSGETFTMSRIAERRMLPDSVSLAAIVLPADKKALADSIMSVVNQDNFVQLAREHSEDKQSMLAGGATADLDPLQLMPELSERVLETAEGRITMAESNGAIFIINVVGKSAPVSKVKVATVKYTVRPSTATHAAASTKAREFYNAAQGSYEAFDKAATDMSLPKRVARVSATDREVQGLENSRQLVRWAFTNKQGAVYEPQELTRDYIVVTALAGVTKAGITPLDGATDEIRRLLIQRRKADMLAGSMTGAGVDAIAAREGLTVVDVPGLRFAEFAIPELGFEPRLIGAICSTKQAGGVSKPVKGNMGVYVYEVGNIVTEANADAESMKVRMESMNEYMMGSALMNALFKKSNTVDNRVTVGF
jgi:peptidyl-prolyl cis-trans isomerase D